jgi:hypothetical protein
LVTGRSNPLTESLKIPKDNFSESSFRDPSGHVFTRDGTVYRQVNSVYQKDYQHLMSSGLYQKLVDEKLLIPHREVELREARDNDVYKILQPEPVEFFSYPYEWCFGQLKEAALLTLKVLKLAIEHGMTLKDGTAYNVTFIGTRPVFIDTLSFERMEAPRTWDGYRQFCEQFLSPLALAAYSDPRLIRCLRTYLEGIPLDLTVKLLPWRARINLMLLGHLYMHQKLQRRSSAARATKELATSQQRLLSLIASLETAVTSLRLPKSHRTEWGEYYDNTNYSRRSFEFKKQAVADFVAKVDPQVVWDLGANDGTFSRIAAKSAPAVVAMDIDPLAVESGFRASRKNGDDRLYFLWIDLTNPSPGLGWGNSERSSLADRGRAEMILALALIHHLAIGCNLPLGIIAQYFAKLGRHAIVEFVPKTDSKVKRLLAWRKDIFTDYSQEQFELEFQKHFAIIEQVKIPESQRTLYLMKAKQPEL